MCVSDPAHVVLKQGISWGFGFLHCTGANPSTTGLNYSGILPPTTLTLLYTSCYVSVISFSNSEIRLQLDRSSLNAGVRPGHTITELLTTQLGLQGFCYCWWIMLWFQMRFFGCLCATNLDSTKDIWQITMRSQEVGNGVLTMGTSLLRSSRSLPPFFLGDSFSSLSCVVATR